MSGYYFCEYRNLIFSKLMFTSKYLSWNLNKAQLDILMCTRIGQFSLDVF